MADTYDADEKISIQSMAPSCHIWWNTSTNAYNARLRNPQQSQSATSGAGVNPGAAVFALMTALEAL